MKSLDDDHENYRTLPESGRHAVRMSVLMAVLCLLLVALVLTGCTIVHYDALPGQGTSVSIYSLGSDKAFTDFKAGIDARGARKLSIGAFDEIQTKGMEQVNQGLKMMVEGAVQGMKP
jgi:hypothetical protein